VLPSADYYNLGTNIPRPATVFCTRGHNIINACLSFTDNVEKKKPVRFINRFIVIASIVFIVIIEPSLATCDFRVKREHR
jgi:hypothetical protein